MCLLPGVSTLPKQGPVIDGAIGETEWSGAVTARLEGGGALRLLGRGEFLYVAVDGRGQGLASLCAAKDDTVRILHASAALGEGRYERAAGGWRRTADFDWKVRDSPAGGDGAERFLRETGWLANPSAGGSPRREFQIRMSLVEALAVTFLSLPEPMTLARWPAGVGDDCAKVSVAQGFLPESAAFDPSAWHRVDGQ